MSNVKQTGSGKQVTNCSPPKNSQSWRARAATHKENVLAILRERGATGVLSSELYDSPERFGRSPRNRVSELRREGFSIRTFHVNAAVVRYVLADRGEQSAPSPRAVVPSESLPLFAGVER
jgi:hypothetical protein